MPAPVRTEVGRLVARADSDWALRGLRSVLVDALAIPHWSTCRRGDCPRGNNRERGRLHWSTIIGTMKDRFGTDGPAFMLLGGCAIVAALLAMGLGRVAVLR